MGIPPQEPSKAAPALSSFGLGNRLKTLWKHAELEGCCWVVASQRRAIFLLDWVILALLSIISRRGKRPVVKGSRERPVLLDRKCGSGQEVET